MKGGNLGVLPPYDIAEGNRLLEIAIDKDPLNPMLLASLGAYDRVDLTSDAEIWYWLPLGKDDFECG